jgi:hypothetical protein
VATGEDEGQPLVGDRAHVFRLGRQRLEPSEELCLLPEHAVAPNAIDRAVPGCGDDPRAG